ncbi:MAG TPA: ABC transporter permease [Candidatus Sulfotelmatobacter sp.]|nr:ABC transporter permease [Candidatus Sulfotelmatobacter sp.]
MAIWRRLGSWLSWFPWYRRQAREADLARELRDHLELEAEEHRAAGLSPGEAAYAAHRALGNTLKIEEDVRAAWGFQWLETLAQDIRYGLRQLRRSPGFTAVAILTLALGIGANTAIFSVINAVMLRMLTVRNPDQLVQVGFQGKHSGESFVGESFSYPLFEGLRQQNQVFTDISAFDYWDSLEARPADSSFASEPAKAQLVSVNFFSILGINTILGRTFAPDEDNGTGVHAVAVISYGLWTRMFARNPSVLGKKLVIGETPFSIIGVASSHFSGVSLGKTYDLWVPLSMQAEALPGGNRLTQSDTNWLSLVARLKPGVSMERARGGLDVVYQEIQDEHDISKWSEQDRRDFFTHRIVLIPAATGTDYMRREFSHSLFLLMAMVGLVLVIACANVANLLLARGSVRQREIAVRSALGAGRWRLTRQLLTESVSLALAGGVLGVLFAYWGSSVLVALMSVGQNRVTLDVHPDLSVLGFTLLIAFSTGVGFGLAPALRATRLSAIRSVQPGFHSQTTSRSGRRLGRGLVIAQVSLSFVMIIGAGLLVRTLRNLESLDPGFDRNNVLLLGFDPTEAGYKGEQVVQLGQTVLERIQQVPGVRSASFSFLTPIGGGGWDNQAQYVEGYTPQLGEDMDVYLNAVGPRFFETLGTPVLLGRDFGPQDKPGSPLVALINQTMSRRFFGERNPIGKHFRLGPWSGNSGFEIIGVVRDAKYLSLREQAPPTAYLYIPQMPAGASPGGVTVEVSSVVPPMSLVPQVRTLLQSVGPRLTATDAKTLAVQVDQSLYQEKLVSALSSFFAGLALLLASIGLYGVLSYAVTRRTNEIGIRVALGAETHQILRMVLREALVLVILGIIIGMPAALAASRLVAAMLYGLKATDPVTILGAAGVMSVVALLASYIPARRAMRVDPMVALRYE